MLSLNAVLVIKASLPSAPSLSHMLTSILVITCSTHTTFALPPALPEYIIDCASTRHVTKM